MKRTFRLEQAYVNIIIQILLQQKDKYINLLSDYNIHIDKNNVKDENKLNENVEKIKLLVNTIDRIVAILSD